MARTRAEHMRWCKERALGYLKENDSKNAVASMLSDLTKHPETNLLMQNPIYGTMGIMAMDSVEDARRFIEGFTE